MGIGAISADRALNYGFTGPNLRAAGVDYDVRVHTPYSSYEDFDFKVPVGSTGDVYDRYLVRNEEMWQSLQILKQAYQKVQQFKGSESEVYHADVPAYYLPPKKDVYTKMEALIYHFKIVMGETDMPVGEVYNSVEEETESWDFTSLAMVAEPHTGCISAVHALSITRHMKN